MSICDFGMKDKVFGTKNLIEIDSDHPLVKLSNFIPWEELFELVLPDLKSSTEKKMYWRGRRLMVRIHLAAYILQQLYNRDERKIEADLKENAAYQIFAGKFIIEKWHVPDHTKIQTFRSRLAPETQRQLANLIAQAAVKAGFADPSILDIDSTIQRPNVTFPSPGKALLKLAQYSKRISDYIDKELTDFFSKMKIRGVFVDFKKIKGAYKAYFFDRKKEDKVRRKYLLQDLFQAICPAFCAAKIACRQIKRWGPEKLPWNIERTIEQILTVGTEYHELLFRNLYQEGKNQLRISLHAKDVAWFKKGKADQKLQFGRQYQIGRIKGNFAIALKCEDVRMEDKYSVEPFVLEHQKLFGEKVLTSLSADKGYYSSKNEDVLLEFGVSEVGISRPCRIKKKPLHDEETTQKLQNRRAGVEAIIGHLKAGGQLNRSRMKSDRTTLSSGYTSVLGFNLRQIMRCQAAA